MKAVPVGSQQDIFIAFEAAQLQLHHSASMVSGYFRLLEGLFVQLNVPLGFATWRCDSLELPWCH